MLRRFNSLMKGSKAPPEASTEHLSLRPTRSVDSASILQSHTALDPLQIAQRFRQNSTTTTPPQSGNGQPSVTSSNSNGLYTSTRPSEGEEGEDARSSLISRVPEESSWKEGYEYGRLDLDSPGTPHKQFPSSEKPTEFHAIDLRESTTESFDSNRTPPAADNNTPQTPLYARRDDYGGDFSFPPVPPQPAGHGQPEPHLPSVMRTSSNAVVAAAAGDQPPSQQATMNAYTAIDIPDAQNGSAVDLECLRKGCFAAGPPRTISAFSTDSMAECCRICQQHTEEQLIDLGCLCRGDLSKAHRSCIEMWFRNKGTNKCEVCQHVATNIPAPASDPMPHFWVWRVGGPYAVGQGQAPPGGFRGVGLYSVTRPVLLVIIKKHPFIPMLWVLLLAFMTYLFVDAINTSTIGYAAMPIGFLFGKARFHPLWAALLILIAGLLFDVLISIFLGASALPVNIIIGVLVVLGLGTAARLILECCHERSVRRNIRRMELTPIFEEVQQGVPQPATQTQPLPQVAPSVV